MVHEILLSGRIVYGLGAFSQIGAYVSELGSKVPILRAASNAGCFGIRLASLQGSLPSTFR